MNLITIKQLSKDYEQLDGWQKENIALKIDDLLTRIRQEPKQLVWRVRAKVGDRIQWYKDVDEV